MNERDTVNSSIRVPRELHDRLKRAAARQDRTVHNLMIHYLRRSVTEDERRAAEEGETHDR